MAAVTVLDQDTYRTINDASEVARLLKTIGVRFATWGIDRLPAHLRSRNLSDAEKQEVLSAFKPELDQLKSQGGYVTGDVISMWPDTPNLEGMRSKFDKKHLHTEDEVRFCVQGRGVFTVYPEAGPALDIELHPGDFICVPANYHHLFNLCSDRHITAIRLFTDPAGWVAHYVK